MVNQQQDNLEDQQLVVMVGEVKVEEGSMGTGTVVEAFFWLVSGQVCLFISP